MTKRIFFNILFLLALMWFSLWIWCIAFGSRPWLSNFGVVAFTVTGFLLGIIYFFSFYQWFQNAREITKVWKRRMTYVAILLALAFLSHWAIKGVLWVATWMGNTYGISFWFFVGFILSGFVLYTKDRLLSGLKNLFV